MNSYANEFTDSEGNILSKVADEERKTIGGFGAQDVVNAAIDEIKLTQKTEQVKAEVERTADIVAELDKIESEKVIKATKDDGIPVVVLDPITAEQQEKKFYDIIHDAYSKEVVSEDGTKTKQLSEGITEEMVSYGAKVAVQKREALGINLGEGVDVDTSKVITETAQKKPAKGKSVQATSVTGDVAKDILIGGLNDVALNKINIVQSDSKVKNRVVGKIGVESELHETLVKAGKVIDEKLSEPDVKSRLSSVFTKEGIEANNPHLLMITALGTIDAAIVSETEQRQSVDGDEKLLKSKEYWAGKTNLETQIGKDYFTSRDSQIVGTKEKVLNEYRKVGKLALELLNEMNLAEETEGDMYSKVSEGVVTPKNKRVIDSKTNEYTFASTVMESKEKEGQKVLMHKDKGVRLVGAADMHPKHDLSGKASDYINNLGDAMKRLNKLLLPGNRELPGAEAFDGPIKTDPRTNEW